MVKASSQLKLRALQAIAAIGFFFLVYIVLIALAVGLTILCSWLGYWLIVNVGHLYIILVGIGLISFGIMILLFLIKFVFSWKFTRRPRAVRIYEEQEPSLFQLLRDITAKTGTDFPKKVYIAPDMNACVYYDSIFLSLFFPVKKNLVIGMALVNSTSVLELTSILAHEFGHFSQRSMKVGSFVHYVNRIIYNLLYENEGFGSFFDRVSSINQILRLFTLLSFKVIRGIQLILQKLFIEINSADMALSREMEFHADAVAAMVAGPSAFERALVRLEYATPFFHQVVSFYQGKIRPVNLYSDHLQLTCLRAQREGCHLIGSFPRVPLSVLNKLNPFRLRINADFDSHPETDERINRLKKLNVPDPADDLKPAVSLFRNEDKIKKLLTDELVPQAADGMTTMTTEAFLATQKAELERETLPEIFNGYFHSRVLFEGIDPEEVTIDNNYCADDPERLFSDEMAELARKENTLRMEISFLTDLDVSTIISVTYDGARYEAKEIGALMKKLEKEHKGMTDTLIENDLKIARSIIKLSQTHDCEDETKGLVRVFKEFTRHHTLHSQITVAVTDFIQNTDGQKINTYVKRIESLEPCFKQLIRELLAYGKAGQAEPHDIENLKQYISQDWTYVGVTKFYESNIQILMDAVESYSRLKHIIFIDSNKQLLYLIAGLFSMDEGTASVAPVALHSPIANQEV